MRFGRCAPFVVAAFAIASGCSSTPEPLGEALLVVETDVNIPDQVNRLRLEVFTSNGTPIRSATIWAKVVSEP